MPKGKTLRRVVLLLPFGIAGTLTILLGIAERLRLSTDHVAELSFLFAKPWVWLLRPWAWLLDWASVPIALYIVLLWLPAALYSAAIWLILHAIDYATSTHARHGTPHPA